MEDFLNEAHEELRWGFLREFFKRIYCRICSRSIFLVPEIMSERKLAEILEKINNGAIFEATTQETSKAVYFFRGINE